MKRYLTIIMMLLSVITFCQEKRPLAHNGTSKTEIIKGSKQYLFVECGHGTASIKQTVTTYVFKKTKTPYYNVKTVLWLQFRDSEGYECYGAWGYELYEDEKMAFSNKSMELEKIRQSKMAFDLLKHLQIPGKI